MFLPILPNPLVPSEPNTTSLLLNDIDCSVAVPAISNLCPPLPSLTCKFNSFGWIAILPLESFDKKKFELPTLNAPVVYQ